ncbi:hypothetical protein CF642_38245, partial [Burkholderia pseudomallei]
MEGLYYDAYDTSALQSFAPAPPWDDSRPFSLITPPTHTPDEGLREPPVAYPPAAPLTLYLLNRLTPAHQPDATVCRAPDTSA